MKKVLVTAILLLAGIACLSYSGNAQVVVALNTSVWNVTYACPAGWSSPANITLTETFKGDFHGAPGVNNRLRYDLRIGLPPGWKFNPNVLPVAYWDVKTSANLQNGTGLITYAWVDVDNAINTKYGTGLDDLWSGTPPVPGDVNTITLQGLECKNENQLDTLFIYNIEVGIIPGQGNPATGDLWAWTENETVGGLPYSSPTPVVYNFPTLGTKTGVPVVNYTPGAAEGIIFIVEPISGMGATPTYHDVQERIKGVDWSTGTPVWPVIGAVDCNGVQTNVGLTGAPVVLTLLDASGNVSTSTFFDGSGPTYSTATQSIVTNPATRWSATGRMELQFSQRDAGDYKVRALAQNVTPGTYAQSIGISNQASSVNVFNATRRAVIFDQIPELPSSWDMNANGLNMPVGSGAGASSPPISKINASTYLPALPSEQVTLDIVDGAITSPLNPWATVPVATQRYTSVKPAAATFATFDGPHTVMRQVSPFDTYTLNQPYILLSWSEGNDPLEFTAFTYVTTSFFDFQLGAPKPSANTYLDPRYDYSVSPLSITPLPVELVSFDAMLRNDVVTLRWTTATETNNYGFDIEKSRDRMTWETIGFVPGAGTSSAPLAYAFKDALNQRDLAGGVIAYRLLQKDRDGRTTYSPVVSVTIAADANDVRLLQNYPNPFNPSTTLTFNLPEAGAVTLAVYNELGQEVARIYDGMMLDAGWHTTNFNAAALPSGLYAYRLQAPSGSAMRTMIVSK